MNTLFFNPDYIAQYYNCSGRTYEEWKALGKPNVLIGFVYSFLGTIFLIILVPFLVVFAKSDFMKYSCYKIMFFIGVVDCLQIPIGGYYCGYAAAVGMVYCMAPTLNYFIGALCTASWCSSSTACMLLAINRCIDLINPYLGRKLFSGKKTYIWLLIPTAYFLYFLFIHTTVTFNSNFYAFFFDPFIGTPERNGTVDSEHYPHIVHSTHNIIVVIVLFSAYSCLVIHIFLQSAKSQDVITMSKLQRQTIMQCTLVCSIAFIAALVYVYMQFLPTPLWVVVCGEIAWHSSHGAAGISYAFLNPTMRKEFIKTFCYTEKVAPAPGTLTTKNSAISSTEQIHMHY